MAAVPVRAFLPPFTPTGRADFVRLVSGCGSTVVDESGTEYLDPMAPTLGT